MTMGLSKGDLLEGRYRIYSRIGEGGMGVVYAAEHVALHRKCAVKVLHPQEAGDQTMIARFRIEAQAAANIRHPNIVEVMDFGITPDDRPFFVMEYLEGESLADRLDRKGRLSEKTSINIIAQVLNALEAAHRVRVVHRDLKPENIFLARLGDGREMVKILDFGISKIVAGTPSRPPAPISGNHKVLTQKGIVFGTPGYMAPETLFGTEVVDSRADLFAVAVLLFEMLIGKRPFHGKSPQATMVATASQAAPPVHAFRPELSADIDAVIAKGLVKDPKYRFQTAAAFLNAVARVGKISLRPSLETAPAVSLSASSPIGELEPPNPDAPKLELESLHPPRHAPKGGAPSHHRDFRREVELDRRRKRRALWRRRASFVFSPFMFLVFAAAIGLVYYFFWYRTPVHVVSGDAPSDLNLAGGGRSQGASDERAPIRTVTIWLDAQPADISVHLADKLVYERPLIVPEGETPVTLRFSKEGYETESRPIVPDQEQTVVVRLKRQKRKRAP